METLLSILQTILLITPIFILAIILVLFFLTRYWQVQSREGVKNCRAQLRNWEAEFTILKQTVHENYSRDDAEPFGMKSSELIDALENIEHKLQTYRSRYVQIQEAVNRVSARRPHEILEIPLDWQQIYRQVRLVCESDRFIQTSLQQAGEQNRYLHRLGTNLAAQARQSHALYLDIKTTLDQLGNFGICGELFEDVAKQVNDIQGAIDSIPLIYLAGNEAEILEVTDKDNIISTYHNITENTPRLTNLLVTIKTWNEQYNKISTSLQELQETSKLLEGTIYNAPSELDFSTILTQLAQLSASVSGLVKKFSHLKAEEMSVMMREVDQTKHIAQDVERQYNLFTQKYKVLHKTIKDVAMGLELVYKRFQALEKKNIYPLTWDVSGPRFASLQQQVDRMLKSKAVNPDQVKEDLKIVHSLRLRLEELAEIYQRVETQHTNYVTLLDKIDQHTYLAWCREARAAAEKVKMYHPDNWEDNNKTDYLSEVQTLEDNLQRWYPKDTTVAIKESELPIRISEGERITGLYQVLSIQVNHVHKHLEETQSNESEAIQSMQNASQALIDINELLRKKHGLPGLSAAQINAFQHETKEMIDKFNNHHQGTLKEKVQRATTLVKRIEQTGSGWVTQSCVELEKQREEMRVTLKRLAAIAQLDDLIVAEAYDHVNQTPWYIEENDQQSQLLITELVPTLDHLNQDFTRNIAVIHKLQEIVEPVILAYEAVEEQQQSALLELERGSDLIPDSGSWSSRSLVLDKARQQFSKLEQEWDTLKSRQIKVMTLVSRMDELQKRYQDISDKARQIVKETEIEQNRILQLKEELEKLVNAWEIQHRAYAGKGLVQRKIQEMLTTLQREYHALERRYTHGHEPYSQYILSLKSLCQTANDALIPINANQKIDVNGEVIP